MTSIDSYLVPVLIENKAAYEKPARIYAQALHECGAMCVVECWLDQSGPEVTSCPGVEARMESEIYRIFLKAAGACLGETVVLSFVEWSDKSTRDAGMDKFTSDPRVQFNDRSPTFGGRRLIADGFKPMLVMASES
jgi:uncharacterized protein YbaA (DUF1428 family)